MSLQELIDFLIRLEEVHPNAITVESRDAEGHKSNHIVVALKKGVVLIEGGKA
jgi:hypothetical protein